MDSTKRLKVISKEIKSLRERVGSLSKERNEIIKEEAISAEKSYKEIGEEAGLTTARIDQILKEEGIRVPLEEGMKKRDKWVENIRRAKTKEK